jgi:hypothetical protein
MEIVAPEMLYFERKSISRFDGIIEVETCRLLKAETFLVVV